MKKRNTLLILGALLASASLVACSSSMNTKGKGIAQLMNDNQERVFYRVVDSVADEMPGKDERIYDIYITKGGKLTRYKIEYNGTSDSKILMDEVVGKSINEVRKLAEERAKETSEIDKVKAKVITDSSGNNTIREEIADVGDYESLTNGQIRDKYYSGYIEGNGVLLLVTEVSKGAVINFDKADGKIVEEKK